MTDNLRCGITPVQTKIVVLGSGMKFILIQGGKSEEDIAEEVVREYFEKPKKLSDEEIEALLLQIMRATGELYARLTD